MLIAQKLRIDAINKVKANQKRLSESDKKFIERFIVDGEDFIFTRFGFKRCDCEGMCNHRNGLKFFPVKEHKIDQKTQNRLFSLSRKVGHGQNTSRATY